MSQAGITSFVAAIGSGILTINNIGPNLAGNFNLTTDGSLTLTPGTNSIDVSETKPNKYTTFSDDFVTAISIIDGNWISFSGDEFIYSNGTATHPGIAIPSIGFPGGFEGLTTSGLDASNNHVYDYIMGAGAYSQSFVIDLIALSNGVNTYTMYIGIANNGVTLTNAEPTDGIYFEYTHTLNGGSWVIKCANSGVRTSVNTATAASTGFHRYTINVNAAATSVSFFIDGIQVGSNIATNIPTAAMNPFFLMDCTLGTMPTFKVDLFYNSLNLTVAR